MPKLDALNSDNPPELLCPGTTAGAGLDLDLSTLSDHVSSRAATIWRCTRKTPCASVLAIKIVFAPDVRPPHDVRNEARTMASLDHPNICPLLNAYYIDSHFILALPFYPFTLRNLLDNPAFRPQATSGETQDESDSFGVVSKAVIAQMCSAVAYLEGEGIAHRDVSPSNWLLDVSGRAVLTDFGTAWLAGRAEEAQTAPLDFELGTGGYRAPELLFGSRSYDPLCIDRWALGCCIAQFFTPFAADGAGSDSDETSEDKSSGIPSPWDAIEQKSRGPQSSAGNAPPRPAWMGTNIRARRPKPVKKAALFDGGWSDFALIGSIFKTLGTPSLDTWPEAASLPDFGKFSFKAFPARSLSGPSILPNLPQSERDSAADLVQRFLVYPYRQRLTARKAMQHPYLSLDKTVPGRTAPLSPDSTNDQEKGALRKHLAHWI